MPRSIQLALPKDFLDLLSCLGKARCRYLVVGAHALASFGFPEQARAVVEQFSRPKRIATLGVPPLQIDIMTSLSGVSFASAWKGRSVVRVGRLSVPFLGRAELIKNKLASGRPKDLLDVAILREGRDE